MTGTIVKGIGGFYYVQTETGLMECRARGVFRKEGIRPLCGDFCEAEPENEEHTRGWITKILPRRNQLIRPAAANADQAVLIFAAVRPDADSRVIDRLLLNMEVQDVPARLVLTKKDIDKNSRGEELRRIYETAGYPVHVISSKTGEGLSELLGELQGKTSILCGPSGAGKSTLIRTLFPHLPAEAGELSHKIGRGKNTTRASELYFADENTGIMDTPGFTSVEILAESETDLEGLFPEFRPWLGQCRFSGCSHRSEPDCRVREALQAGKIAGERYESYKDMYAILQDRSRFS